MRSYFSYPKTYHHRYKLLLLTFISLFFSGCLSCNASASTVSSTAIPQADSRYELFNEISRQLLAHNTTITIDTYRHVCDDSGVVFNKNYYCHQNQEDPLLSGFLYEFLISSSNTYITYGDYSGNCDTRLYIEISYAFEKEDFDSYLRHLEHMAKELKSDNDYESIKAAYDYVINMADYDYDYNNYSDYEGYLTGKMVCQGYSMALYRLLAYMDIPVLYIYGYSNPRGYDEGHAWNMVKLEDSWYNVDATWDDLGEGKPSYYRYFLKSNKEFPRHRLDKEISHYESYVSSTSYLLPTDLSDAQTDLSDAQTEPTSTPPVTEEVYVEDKQNNIGEIAFISVIIFLMSILMYAVIYENFFKKD